MSDNKKIIKNLNTYLDITNNKSLYIIWIFVFSILILFTPYIENIPNNYFIFNSKIVNRIEFYIIYAILVFVIFGRFILIIKEKYIISNFLKFILFLVTSYYLYNRLFTSTIQFTKIFKSYNIVFLDVLIIVLILMIINEVVNFINYNNIKCNSINTDYYLSDDVKIFDEQDLNNYEYRNYVEEIYNLIKNNSSNRAFTISINSKWGTGKTTFLKAVEKRLESSDEISDGLIIINFNVWKYDSKEALLNAYFNELENELKKYSGNSKNTLNDYFSSLFLYAGLNYKNLIDNTFLNFFNGKATSYDKTAKLIERINKKIIVLIDDLDRLKSDEINQTLKIIRNNSEFKNVFILATIDNEYLIQEGNLRSDFLEKIFNLQLDLPLIPSLDLYNYFIDQLNVIGIRYNDILIEKFKSIFKDSKLYNGEIFFEVDFYENNKPAEYRPKTYTLFNHLINSRRQANRFINQLKISLVNINNEDDIMFDKYILYQILIFKYPVFKKYFSDNYLHKILKVKENLILYDKNVYEKFLEENSIQFSPNDNYAITNILERLFSIDSKLENNQHDINNNDIILYNYFPIYYNHNIYSQTIDISEIKKAIINKSLAHLFDSYKYRHHFDNSIFKNICLIEENYSTDEQILSFIKLINDEYISNVSLSEFLLFIHKLEDSKLHKVFKIIFSDVNIKENSIVQNYLKNFILIHSESISIKKYANIDKNYLDLLFQLNSNIKNYIDKTFILKLLYSKVDECLNLYKARSFSSSEYINLVLRCYFVRNNDLNIFYFEQEIEEKYKRFIIENINILDEIFFTDDYNVLQTEILYLFFDDEMKSKIKNYESRGSNNDNRLFKYNLFNSVKIYFFKFLNENNVNDYKIEEIKEVINKNIKHFL